MRMVLLEATAVLNAKKAFTNRGLKRDCTAGFLRLAFGGCAPLIDRCHKSRCPRG